MLNALSRELVHESGGRIYKRHKTIADILVKPSLDEFNSVLSKRLTNLRYYKQDERTIQRNYESILGNLVQGERVMVASRSSLVYKGIF